jgi:HSP20 family protein
MSLIKWKRTNGGFPTLPSLYERFYDDDFFSNFPMFRKFLSVPAVNVLEEKDKFILEVAAPGMEKKDFEITVKEGVMTVKAEKEEKIEETEKGYTRREYDFHSFERSFWLPENVNAEKVDAKYENGVLKLILPKIEVKEPKVKAIKVS